MSCGSKDSSRNMLRDSECRCGFLEGEAAKESQTIVTAPPRLGAPVQVRTCMVRSHSTVVRSMLTRFGREVLN